MAVRHSSYCIMAGSEEDDFGAALPEFKFKEPTEDELFAELASLTGTPVPVPARAAATSSSPVTAAQMGTFGFGAVTIPPDTVTDYGIENVQLTEADMCDPALLAELAGLSLSPGSEASPARTSMPIRDDGDAQEALSKRADELKQLALAAKRSGDIDQAKAYLLQMKQLDAPRLDRQVESRIERVEAIARQANPDPTADLKRQALEAKKRGDIAAAKMLLQQSKDTETACRTAPADRGNRSPSPSPSAAAQKRAEAKRLVDRLTSQAQLCVRAAQYYERAGSKHDCLLFLNRKKAAEADMHSLAADLKRGVESLPLPQAQKVQFSTQEMDPSVPEKDIVINVDCSGIPAKRRPEYQLKVIFEWPPNACPEEQERLVDLTSATAEYLVGYKGVITRDLKQQKFFEHRRLKFELFLKETSMLFFTNVTLCSSGYVKLASLSTQCKLQADVRVSDQDQEERRHSFVLKASVKLRYPVSKKEPERHQEEFIFFPDYGHHTGLYVPRERPAPSASPTPSPSPQSSASANQVDMLASYVVIEREIERLHAMGTPEALTDLVELEGKRDRLALAVEMGELSMPDYLANVKKGTVWTRTKCIQAKQSGDMEAAKRYLSYVKLMEEEVREAEAQQLVDE